MYAYVDLDNTIAASYKLVRAGIQAGPEFRGAEVIPGAVKALREIQKRHIIVILTARPWATAETDTRDWLNEHRIPYDELVVVTHPQEKIPILVGVRPADVFIDDMSRDHENSEPWTELYWDVIREIEDLEIPFVRFKGDWKQTLREVRAIEDRYRSLR